MRLVLRGPNGAGKSTLVKALAASAPHRHTHSANVHEPHLLHTPCHQFRAPFPFLCACQPAIRA
eukprot:2426848-Pleurochrysis_carterae.AAC.1